MSYGVLLSLQEVSHLCQCFCTLSLNDKIKFCKMLLIQMQRIHFQSQLSSLSRINVLTAVAKEIKVKALVLFREVKVPFSSR